MASQSSVRIDPEFKSLIPPLTTEEYAQLEANLVADGCRDPLVVWGGHGILLDGHNRLEICQRRGVEYRTIDRILTDRDAALLWIEENQLGRRNLSEDQKAAIALCVAERKSAIARKERASNAGKSSAESRTPEKTIKTRLNLQDTSSRKLKRENRDSKPSTRAAVAKEHKVSERKLKDVAAIAKKKPEAVAAIKSGEKTIKQVKGEIKAEQKQAVAEQIAAEPAPVPKGPFRVIAIDPPWKYDSRADDITHRGRNQYPDMTTEQICALPVRDLAHDDCVLWLWTTNAFMADAYQCLEAWGFTAKTILTWDKINIGLGDWLRNVTEHCILAVRGKPVVTLTNQTTLISEKRREHSRKPDAFYALVESLCPGSKLEMFARAKRDGWQSWGAETEKFNGAA